MAALVEVAPSVPPKKRIGSPLPAAPPAMVALVDKAGKIFQELFVATKPIGNGK
jgi:hypothetical protein